MLSAPRKVLIALIAGLASSAAIAAAPAGAAVCGDDGTTRLFDSEGYYFDFSQSSAAGPIRDTDESFATLYDSGSLAPAGSPPGPRAASDSYDGFGALYVGGTELANLYHSNDNNSCSLEEGDRERVYPVVQLAGLDVQRKLYVAPSGLPGIRILNLLTNRGAAPVTTSVQVGDTQSGDNWGDLGSDGDTAVRASSDGNLELTTADRWAVTSDDATTNSDLALAHVFDGPDGADRIDFVTLLGLPAEQPADNLAYRWENVTIAPGQTAAFLSYEIQQGVTGAAAASENSNAAQDAQAYQTAPLTTIYAGMSDTEIAAVRNWAKPPLNLSASAKKEQEVRKLAATIGCDDGCTVDATGIVKARESGASAKAKRATRKLKLKPATLTLGAGQQDKLKLKLKKKQQASQLSEDLESGEVRSAKAKLNLVATSVKGATASTTLKVTLEP